jgi:hypothetical protein
MLEVWKHHHKLSTFPANFSHELRGPNDIAILDQTGAVVKTFKSGAWDAVGRGIQCAFTDDDPACTTCHPVDPGIG